MGTKSSGSWIVPDWPSKPSNVRALSTTRFGGCSAAPFDDGQGGLGWNLGDHVGDAPAAVQANRDLLQSMLPTPVTFLSQIHGNMAVEATQLFVSCEADAVYSTKALEVCAVMTADCLPVLFASADGNYVGAAHAGWRGLADGVLTNTVEIMGKEGARGITAWMGPAIGPDHFEVGEELIAVFEKSLGSVQECFKPTAVKEKYFANLYALARKNLAQCGVEQVYGGNYCTYNDPARFYSYRRDKRTGRMATLIWRE